MSEKENIEIRDIAHEFNVIVDSVKDSKSDFIHDRYFRFAFAEPSRMAELLTLFSRHNPSLKAFRLRWNFLMLGMPLMTLN